MFQCKKLLLFMKISRTSSWTTGPNVDLFVLISIYFHADCKYGYKILKKWNFWKLSGKLRYFVTWLPREESFTLTWLAITISANNTRSYRYPNYKWFLYSNFIRIVHRSLTLSSLMVHTLHNSYCNYHVTSQFMDTKHSIMKMLNHLSAY